MGALNKLAGALALTGALSASADAQEAENVALPVASEVSAQVTDCVGVVREQRDLQKEIGVVMSRSEQKSLLHECRNGELTARIAEQQVILAALDEALLPLHLRVENQSIVDELGNELAKIIEINGRLVIRRAEVQGEIEASRERQQQMLDEAEQILNDLVS